MRKRNNALKEIITTERDFVGHLNKVMEVINLARVLFFNILFMITNHAIFRFLCDLFKNCNY